MRIICILAEHFCLKCETLRNPQPAGCLPVITCTPVSQKLVLDYSPELKNIYRGMPVQQALALNRNIKIIDGDLPYYRNVFDDLLNALELISPQVEGSEPGCAYLGLDGLQSIYPDNETLVTQIKKAISDSINNQSGYSALNKNIAHFTCKLGIAEGKFPAYLAALYSRPGECQDKTGADNIRSFLEDIDCNVLPISAKSKSKLHEFGISTLGQIAVLDPGPLQAQFGPEGKTILELARGHDDTPLYSRTTQEIIEESTMLSPVTVSLEAILLGVESLLFRPLSDGRLKKRGISSMVIWTKRWGTGYWEQDIHFKEPAADIKSALLRIKPVLENCPQPGPVEQLGIRLTGLAYRTGKQKSLFSDVRARDHLLDDIKQLEDRMGRPQVFKIKEVEPWSRIPERRFALTPVSR